jgi:hypothetical protein
MTRPGARRTVSWWAAGALAVALALGCGKGEQACVEGPTVTYIFGFEDFLSGDVPLEGVEACIFRAKGACGCVVSDARGFAELELPSLQDVVLRFERPDLVPLYSFYATPAHGDVLLQYALAPRTIGEALVRGVTGTAIDRSRGVVAAQAWPVAGASLEGSVAELADPSGGAPDDVAGPFYIDPAVGLPNVEATSSPSRQLFVLWVNVPPGPYFVRATTADNDDVYRRCPVTATGSGWAREQDGSVALELEVFADAISDVYRYDCMP